MKKWQQDLASLNCDDMYERIDNIAYIAGYEKTPHNTYCKITNKGYIEYDIDDLQFRSNFNWLMGIFAQVNLHDKYWNIYLTNRQVLVANEYKKTHTIFAYSYSHINELTKALFMALSDYAKVRRNSKDYPEIRQKHLDKLVANYEKCEYNS